MKQVRGRQSKTLIWLNSLSGGKVFLLYRGNKRNLALCKSTDIIAPFLKSSLFCINAAAIKLTAFSA